MQFNKHYDLEGRHAFLSASKSAWTNYDHDKLEDVYRTSLAARRGTELHEFASEAIRLGINLPRNSKTINMYVNDAIGYRMTPEQILFYSENCFGTADSIMFKKNKLRIHDLKTGVNPCSFRQLEVYAAIFCLEYGIRVLDIDIELRIYQNDEVKIFHPELSSIINIMDTIVEFDTRINTIKSEEM